MDRSKDPKQQVRDEIRRALRDYSDQGRLEESARITERIVSSPVWAAADTVFAFVSLPDEVETTALCEQALREGKRLGLPRFGDEGLVFYEVSDLDALRVDNSMAIRQPGTDLPVLSSTQEPRQPGRLLVITPGRAFTQKGDRLGRGGGFYDQFFAALRVRHVVFQAIGIAFDRQLRESLPTTATDESIHGVVTPKKSFGLT